MAKQDKLLWASKITEYNKTKTADFHLTDCSELFFQFIYHIILALNNKQSK